MSAVPDSTLADPKDHLIADLHRQLAERTAERDAALAERGEALAQQAATAEVLQVINFSPGDLSPVFEAMLEKAVRLCDAAFGILHTFDGHALDAVALHHVPERFVEYLTRGPLIPDPERSLLGKC